MCGISGFLDSRHSILASDLGAIVRTMATTLRHRGPDDEGEWVDAEAGVALGFRRLSVQDLSVEGHQPMLSACGRYVIVFNGEVYNFRALRAELERHGHRFRGHSDTEIMLTAISEWGLAAAVRRFIGMFAFALWDRQERTLSLARDRLGIKPLYYGWSGRLFLFASELKAFRSHPAFRAEIDRDAIAAYMRHNYIPAPSTIYRGFFKLLPGTILRLRSASEAYLPEPEIYWSARESARLGAANPLDVSASEAETVLEDLLRDAIRLRLESDVPLGAFLSGGIDSSLVAALMRAESPRRIRTFTIGFHEASYNEAPYARAVANHLETDHTELHVTPADSLDLISRIPEWYDEPFADSSQLPTFLLSQMTRRHVTVALSGDGGDELFAGYGRYCWAESAWKILSRFPAGWRIRLAGLLSRLSPPTLSRVTSLIPHRDQHLVGSTSLSSAQRPSLDDVDALYRRVLSHWENPERLVLGAKEPKGILWDDSLARELPDFIARAQLLDLMTYLPDDILTKVDRASMAVGLEVRVPLLDHRVVELASRLPLSLKVRRGKGKWLLRRVLSRHVPAELLERPKMGFGVPIDSWLRGPLKEWAEELLDERRLKQEGFLDPRPIRDQWQEHLSGRRNWHYPLWDVLMFQAWNARWG